MRLIAIFVAGLIGGIAINTAVGQGQNRGVHGVNHVGITVPDIDAAVDYYSNTLGFKEAFRAQDEAGNTRLVYMQVSRDTFIELNRANGRPIGINHVGIHVESTAAAARLFGNAGAEVSPVRVSGTGSVLSNVTDLNGIRIELSELPPESEHYKAISRWDER